MNNGKNINEQHDEGKTWMRVLNRRKKNEKIIERKTKINESS